jgi:general secretion pathway protein J
MTMRLRVRRNGFTLLEMLVVLIIVSLISSILFEALGQIYKLESRFGQHLAESQQGAMYNDWYRQVVQGLQNDYALGKDVFKGESASFTGVTTSPLSLDYGTPTAITLSMEYNGRDDVTDLLYQANDRKTRLTSWPGRRSTKFVYIDDKGEQHDTWPPEFGLWPQLPNMIMLQYQKEGEPQFLAAAPRGSKDPKEPIHDMLGVAP